MPPFDAAPAAACAERVAFMLWAMAEQIDYDDTDLVHTLNAV